MTDALYGERGFYRRTTSAAHFRTSVDASPLFARAIARLATLVDDGLDRPDPFDVVDVGAGDGRLLEALATGCPKRWRLTAVEVTPGSDGRVVWRSAIPRCSGLLVANEWLDNVPCDVVELTDDGPRIVLNDGTLGQAPVPADARWLRRWWPLEEVGERAEVGRSRDEAWAAAVGRLDRGVALAIDYAHGRDDRPPYGTFTGYRDGRQVPPVADGSCDLTAHVALDACAAAAATATARVLTTQRQALRALGVHGRCPAYGGDPVAYLAELRDVGERAELLDPAGLGGFGWLLQSVRGPLPAALHAPSRALAW